MDMDIKEGWQLFELRGTFLGRENYVGDGPLDLCGAVSAADAHLPGLPI
jgi:hypothetical protein